MFDNLVNIYDDFTKNERTQSLERLASEYGFEFQKRESFGEQTTYIKGFKIFDTKGTKRFLGVLSQNLRSEKGRIRFYDYLKTKDLETKTTSIVEIFVDDLFVDPFIIKPKKSFGRLKNLFSRGKENDLEEFYKKFKVLSSADNPELMFSNSSLNSLLKRPGMRVEGEGNYLLFYFRNKEIKLIEALDIMDFAEAFIETIDASTEDGFV